MPAPLRWLRSILMRERFGYQESGGSTRTVQYWQAQRYGPGPLGAAKMTEGAPQHSGVELPESSRQSSRAEPHATHVHTRSMQHTWGVLQHVPSGRAWDGAAVTRLDSSVRAASSPSGRPSGASSTCPAAISDASIIITARARARPSGEDACGALLSPPTGPAADSAFSVNSFVRTRVALSPLRS